MVVATPEELPVAVSAGKVAITRSKVGADAVAQVPEMAMFRDANGSLQPLAFGPAARSQSLILDLSPDAVGANVTIRLWRNLAGTRDTAPWIQLQSIVRGDGTVPIAGLTPGRYDLEVVHLGEPSSVVNGIQIPGEVRLAMPTPAR